MKPELVEKIWLLVVDKLIIASIVGVGLFSFSWLSDVRLERLKSDLRAQQAVTQERIHSSDALWRSLYQFGVAFRDVLSSGGSDSDEDLGAAIAEIKLTILNEGRFIGIDETLSFLDKLNAAIDIERLEDLKDRLENREEGAADDLQSFYDDFINVFWFPMLRQIEDIPVSQCPILE